jgi:hypothetical protein
VCTALAAGAAVTDLLLLSTLDSLVLQLCTRAMANLATFRAGSLSLVESRSPSVIADLWNLFPHSLQAVLCSWSVFNICRLPHYLPHVGNAGGAILIAHVISSALRSLKLAAGNSDLVLYHNWVIRRLASSLGALTGFSHTLPRVVRGGGVTALVRTVQLLVQDLKDDSGPRTPSGLSVTRLVTALSCTPVPVTWMLMSCLCTVPHQLTRHPHSRTCQSRSPLGYVVRWLAHWTRTESFAAASSR